MKIKKLNIDSPVSEVNASTAMEYRTQASCASVVSESIDPNIVQVTINEQLVEQSDLKEIINFLKAVRRSLKAAAK